MKPSPTVERVLRGDLCTGCGLCAAVSGGAIRMEAREPGYLRPRQRGEVEESAERVIATACPGSVVAPWPAGETKHPSWGPYRSVTTGFATNDKVRFAASSGGAVTALAAHALSSGLVDRVVHVIPDSRDPAANAITVSRSVEEIVRGAGSRYVASSPLNEIDSILEEGGRIGFVGKPCDVSALRQLALVDPRVNAHVPVMLTFFCAGVPSRGAVTRVVETLGFRDDELEAFRYRGEGWPGRATARAQDGREASMTYEESWGGFLSKEVQFRCKICPDAVGGVADIACGDAWYGGETGYPTFEELDGRSLIVSRTARGEALLGAAVNAGALSCEPLDIGQIDLMQPSQAARKQLVGARTAALAALFRPRPAMRGLSIREAARYAPVKEQARNFLGTIRRALSGRLSRR